MWAERGAPRAEGMPSEEPMIIVSGTNSKHVIFHSSTVTFLKGCVCNENIYFKISTSHQAEVTQWLNIDL